MKTPTDYELERFMAHVYDPVAAREYYLRTRKLKGRKKGRAEVAGSGWRSSKSIDPKVGKTREQIAKSARTKQRKELAEAINKLEDRLKKLEQLIKDRERKEASENRKSKAKKERAAKERDKPKTAAEKAEAARENEKYRDRNKQKLKNEAKKRDDKSGGGSSKKKGSGSDGKHTVSELRSLATRVKGQIALAKQKLAAL
jgi:hypothetical protein